MPIPLMVCLCLLVLAGTGVLVLVAMLLWQRYQVEVVAASHQEIYLHESLSPSAARAAWVDADAA